MHGTKKCSNRTFMELKYYWLSPKAKTDEF